MPIINPEDVMQFISGYGSSQPPQSIEEIQGDFQLAGLKTVLNSCLSRNATSRILDIGCGNGVLMVKLVELDAFKNHPKLEYFGFDFPDLLMGAFETANNLKILPHVRLLPYESRWTDNLTDSCIVISRNVFHELKIEEASKLILEICSFLPDNSIIFLQDMTTLPNAEKGRAGWLGIHLAKVFEKGGIKTIHTPDTSKRGIDVFLIEGRRQAKCKLTEKDICEALIAARKEQLRVLSLKYEDMKEEPNNKLPLLRLGHDITAITLALRQFVGKTEKGQETNEGQTVASTFDLAFSSLSDYDLDELRKNFQYPEIRGFQNRGHYIEALDNFLRSDKTIFILMAGQYIGKKTVVWWALYQKLKHDRLPLYVNLKEGTDILSIMEDVAVQLRIERFLDVEVLASLRNLPTEELRKVISKVLTRLVTKTILILDGFETVTDPDGKIENEDVMWLIDFWSSLHKAKIIIETRSEVKEVPFERCQFERMGTFPSIGKNKHQYTIQLLHELIPIDYRAATTEFGGYPLELLDALDNHPYFTYVAGTIIRNNPDSACLRNGDFIANLKTRLYSTIFSAFGLTDIEKDRLYALTLVQDAFPLKFVDMATEDSRITKKLLEKGLLLECSPGRFRPLGILRRLNIYNKERDKRNQIDQKWHSVFADVFKRLYEIESDPSFYRQAYFHTTLGGNKSVVTYHLPEISICADSWYHARNFAYSLWAYRKIQEKRKLHPKEQMRMASCLIRTDEVTEGENLYQDLIKKYKSWKGVKSSYVDSLLNIKRYADRALKMLLRIPEQERDFYWHRQAANCYKQLSKRKEAYAEYEKAILDAPIISVWSILHEFFIYAREVGDNDIEWEWLDYAWNELKLRSDALRKDLGAFYERNDMLEEAEEILREAHQANPSDAYCILPLIKTLCRLGKIDEAELILKKTPSTAGPQDVLVYAKVVMLKTLGRFSESEGLLLALPQHERYRTSIHRWGQWADLFLSWCITLQGREKIEIAKRGLKFVKEAIEERDVPAMLACLELSKITGDAELQANLQKTIREVNESISF